MHRDLPKRFNSLQDRDRALKQGAFQPAPRLYFAGKRPSSHKPGTLGHFADQVRIRPVVVIEQFARAGIHGLTPNHELLVGDKEALLAYLRRSHGLPAKQAYVDAQPPEPKIFLVQDLNARILRELALQPELLHTLAPRKFEELVAKLLEDQGCEVALTKQTRDGGYDIFGKMKAGPTEFVFLAECKKYAPDNRVGVEVVRSLYGVTEAHKANLGLIVTTSSFSRDAREEKIRIGPRIDLKEFNDLKNWLLPYTGGA